MNYCYAPLRGELFPCEKEFFDSDAVELARFILGKYLLCPQTDIGLIRIVETEAYPVDDLIYTEIFGDDATQQALPNQAGVLVRLSAKLHAASTSTAIRHPDNLYITAKGSNNPQSKRSLVLIRSCMPQFLDQNVIEKIGKQLGYTKKTPDFFKSNLLINPHVVAKALSKDFESEPMSDPVLYEGDGFRLFFCTDAHDPVYGPVKYGRRVLDSKGKFRNGYFPGIDSKYRFVLLTEIAYDYQERGTLALLNTAEMFPLTQSMPPPVLPNYMS